MTRSLKVLPEAKQDLIELQQFYEKQAIGLGDYCVDNVIADLDRLKFFAGIHPQVYGYYRSLVHRFPLSIYYTILSDEIVVVAVLDNRKNPKTAYKRLSKNNAFIRRL